MWNSNHGMIFSFLSVDFFLQSQSHFLATSLLCYLTAEFEVGKHAVLANPSSKGPREFIVLSEMQAER